MAPHSTIRSGRAPRRHLWRPGVAPGAGGGESLQDRYDEIWIPANEMVSDVSVFPAAGTRQETTLQAAHYDFWSFDDALGEHVYFQFIVPEDFDTADSTSVSVRLYCETDATTGTATMRVSSTLPIGDGENLDVTAINGFENITVSANATTRYLAIDRKIPWDTMFGSPAAGDLITGTVYRPSGGFTDDVRLTGLAFQYHKLAANNAQWS